MSFNRRDFLRTSASLAAVAATEAAFAKTSQAQDAPATGTGRGDPMERLNVAVIGFRSRGMEHISGLAGRNNCVVTHVCDTWLASGLRGESAPAAARKASLPLRISAWLQRRSQPLLRLAVKLSCFTTADTFKMLRNCPVSRTFDCDLS